MADLFAWNASLCFFICGAPQAYKCIKEKNGKGLASLSLFFYMVGEISLIIATFMKTPENYALLSSTFFNLCCLSVILYYKINDWKLERNHLTPKRVDDDRSLKKLNVKTANVA